MRSASSYPKDSRSPTLRIICESTKPTDESSKDQDLSFLTNNCFEDTDNTSQQNFSQENISIKLQLLVRTGTSTSRISLLSSPILRLLERTSERPSDASQPEEVKFCENMFLRPSLSPPTKLTAFVDEFWMPNKEAREAYVKNLKFRHALDSEGRQKLQSVVIFDWDGTLFHGTDLEETKTSKSSEAKLLLRSLDKAVSNLLSKAISYCNTYIITSFKEGLVESRSRMFLPLTYATIINHNVPIITMSHYDNNSFVIGSDGKPRRKGLLSIRDQFDGKVTTNMMFMVDSQTKVDMMNSLISQFEKPVVKMVKFKEYPKIKELIKQQELLYKEFENILLKMRNCTIHLSKKKET